MLAHPVIGLTPDGHDGISNNVKDLWSGVRLLCERVYDDQSGFQGFVPIFGDDRSDRIVPKRSQAAFFTSITEVRGVDHLTVHQNSDTVEKVLGLLEEDPEGPSTRFQKGKF